MHNQRYGTQVSKEQMFSWLKEEFLEFEKDLIMRRPTLLIELMDVLGCLIYLQMDTKYSLANMTNMYVDEFCGGRIKQYSEPEMDKFRFMALTDVYILAPVMRTMLEGKIPSQKSIDWYEGMTFKDIQGAWSAMAISLRTLNILETETEDSNFISSNQFIVQIYAMTIFILKAIAKFHSRHLSIHFVTIWRDKQLSRGRDMTVPPIYFSALESTIKEIVNPTGLLSGLKITTELEN